MGTDTTTTVSDSRLRHPLHLATVKSPCLIDLKFRDRNASEAPQARNNLKDNLSNHIWHCESQLRSIGQQLKIQWNTVWCGLALISKQKYKAQRLLFCFWDAPFRLKPTEASLHRTGQHSSDDNLPKDRETDAALDEHQVVMQIVRSLYGSVRGLTCKLSAIIKIGFHLDPKVIVLTET